jgi:euchromatic histone-lysine N-methyltransferase
MIPQHAFICAYFGEVHAAGAFDALVERGGHDGAYSMDMALRPDRDWEGNWVEGAPGSVETAEFVVCGLRRRNVAAFFNHSCAPNCFVQPVLADHHDARLPKICIFAAEDVAPFTQLTWDYGTDYASLKFDEGCRCGAADCITRRPGGGRR